jgi:hypothetical protein
LGKNRIAEYLREMDSAVAKVVVVSDVPGERVTLSIGGEKLIWLWRADGLLRPGAHESLPVHPLAAEVLVAEEIEEFLGLEGVGENEVIYVSPDGQPIDGIFFNPACLGDLTYRSVFAKETLKRLHLRYREQGRKVTQELIGDAISCGALGAFLSLVNL